MIQLLLISTLLVWEIYWTYIACWLAFKNGHKKLFLFFLIFSTLGIAGGSGWENNGEYILKAQYGDLENEIEFIFKT